MAVLIRQAQGKKVEATEQGKLTKAQIKISRIEYNFWQVRLQNLCKMGGNRVFGKSED